MFLLLLSQGLYSYVTRSLQGYYFFRNLLADLFVPGYIFHQKHVKQKYECENENTKMCILWVPISDKGDTQVPDISIRVFTQYPIATVGTHRRY